MAKRGLIFHRPLNGGKKSVKWYTLVSGKLTPLDDLDPTAARAQAKALKAAATGAKHASDDVAAAATAINYEDEGLPPPAPPPPQPKAPPTPSAPPVDASAAAPSSSGPVRPDGAAGDGFAADVNAAAGEAHAKAAAAAEEIPDFDDGELDDFVDEIVGQGAAMAVEVQVRLQEWAWKRYGKIQCAQVPPDHPSRELGVKLWGKTFRRLLPKKIPIPDWVGAIAFVAMKTTQVQLGKGAHRVGDQPPGGATDGRGDNVVDIPFQEAA